MLSKDHQNILQDSWGKKVAYLPRALSAEALEDINISPKDLFDLALHPQANARLLKFENENVAPVPIDENLNSDLHLNASGTTLFVQDMDTLFPEVHDLKDLFPWLPYWRFEDVMGSYSTENGSAAPHMDYYDVFIIQVSGQKKWIVENQQREFHEFEGDYLKENSDFKILKNLKEPTEYILNPGDILYVPTRTAHFAIADISSFSYSVGLRAPRYLDILPLSQLSHEQNLAIEKVMHEDHRIEEKLCYQNRFEIPNGIANVLEDSRCPQEVSLRDFETLRNIGLHVTDSNSSLEFDQTNLTESTVSLDVLTEHPFFSLDLNCRVAFLSQHDGHLIFINGEEFTLSRDSYLSLLDSFQKLNFKTETFFNSQACELKPQFQDLENLFKFLIINELIDFAEVQSASTGSPCDRDKEALL